MKKSRILCLLLSFGLLVSLGVPASAEGQAAGTTAPATKADASRTDGLFYEYLLHMAEQQTARDEPDTAVLQSTGEHAAGAALSGMDRRIYDLLAERIAQVASGELLRTVFEFSLEELGVKQEWTTEELGSTDPQECANKMWAMLDFDRNTVIHALLADFPYELYWYDKGTGAFYQWSAGIRSRSMGTELVSLSFDSTAGLTFTMAVAQEYAGTEVINQYPVSLDMKKYEENRVQKAVDTAAGIVRDNAGKDDLQKLTAYKEAICGLVSYNDAAAESTTSGQVIYGNPWQLIYVFDGDETTNVVCEGYAKAFQYLCDLSTFQGDVQCRSVEGDLVDETNQGEPHMWNILRMPDGKNYLADLTNCDEDSIGAPDALFLKGVQHGPAWDVDYFVEFHGQGGGTPAIVGYIYREDTLSLWDESFLQLSDQDYIAETEPSGELCQVDPNSIRAQDGTVLSRGHLAELESVAFHVDSTVAELEIHCLAAFYDANSRFLFTGTGACTGSDDIIIPITENVSRAATMKLFLLDSSYRVISAPFPYTF